MLWTCWREGIPPNTMCTSSTSLTRTPLPISSTGDTVNSLSYRCESSTNSQSMEDRKTPKRGLFLFCQVVNTINLRCIKDCRFQAKERLSVIFMHNRCLSASLHTPLHGLAHDIALFINCHTGSKQNQFVVCHGSRRLAERDLYNLMNSLWARAEESSEEILC